LVRGSKASALPKSILTVLLVQQNLELILLLVLQRVLQPSHRLLVCQLAIHEAASVGFFFCVQGCECGCNDARMPGCQVAGQEMPEEIERDVESRRGIILG